jgi:glycosyltransferase involved in cell wall biosynthesis
VTVEAEVPVISVIIPVRNNTAQLGLCLEHVLASTFKHCEIIVVDDGSEDHTPDVAAELGVRVLRLERQCGPSAARNRGAEIARGDYLFFLDADVCVYPDTLNQIAETFARDQSVDGIFGSYDTQPGALNILSQYKNLFHHFVHQHSCEEASTFWSGCGAIRRKLFLDMGGFDTSYGHPSIEDIELGVRLRKAGRRIILNKEIQVTHLKRWTFWSMIKTDVKDRGIPWTQLILRESALPNDLNLRISQRFSTVLAYGILALFGVGIWFSYGLLLVPVLSLLAVIGLDYWSEKRRIPDWIRVMAVVGSGAAIVAVCFLWGRWALLVLAFLLGIILINFRFYLFFTRERQILFAALVIPLHVLYYLYSGLAFTIGVALHVWKTKISASLPRRKEIA